MIGRLRVKICGLTRDEDARHAVSLGADALGFVFWPRSPRAVDPDRARTIAALVPPFVSRVGVFVDASPREVRDTASYVGLDIVQLHGDEDVAAFADLGVRVIKVIEVDDDARVARALALPAAVLTLADATDRERRGGTGRLANWARAADVARQRPLVLAGGLSAANVVEAVRAVNPWAIDVSSGVEDAPGIKSREKLEALFAAVRAARAEDV